LGASVEWDADIIEDRENEFISWASVEGADVDNLVLWFKPAPGDRGTEVKVVIESPPGGVVASAVAKLFGEEPQQQIGDELRRFKMLMMKRAKFRQQKVNQGAKFGATPPDLKVG